MKLHFTGRTPYTVLLPVPFVSRSAARGEVVFDPDGEIPDEDGENLLAVDPRFKRLGRNGAAIVSHETAPPTRPAKRKPPRGMRRGRRIPKLSKKLAPSPAAPEGADSNDHLTAGEGQQE